MSIVGHEMNGIQSLKRGLNKSYERFGSKKKNLNMRIVRDKNEKMGGFPNQNTLKSIIKI